MLASLSRNLTRITHIYIPITCRYALRYRTTVRMFSSTQYLLQLRSHQIPCIQARTIHNSFRLSNDHENKFPTLSLERLNIVVDEISSVLRNPGTIKELQKIREEGLSDPVASWQKLVEIRLGAQFLVVAKHGFPGEDGMIEFNRQLMVRNLS